ncbi:MAG: two-component hybrid sensor and regulator [Verrucomicrobiales bacterium]|nr:two-component hybrid sensor and regulator [Verrucomicrobiales bacterium]
MITASDILKASILIVDDQDANVSLLEEMLRAAGYVSITSTRDPRKVCELHRKNHYSLILLDLNMPGLDGFQVMEGLKEIGSERYLPVLVQTSQPNYRLRALRAGARDFVSKPFDLAEILVRVHNMIEVRLLHRDAEMALVRKLEQKNTELEQAVLKSRQAHEEITVLNGSLEQRVQERTADLEKASQDLLRRNQEIQNFYHTLSHELKTPLTSILDFVSIVGTGLAGPVNDQQKEFMGFARESCDYLCICINDLLDSTRLDTGKLRLHLQATSLASMVERLVAKMNPIAVARKITLSHETQPGLADVTLDEHRITQVITNLVTNALKFTPAGGKVVVRASKFEERPEFICVSVQDTGGGIPKADQEQIFDRLYQVKTGDAATEQGFGLGLYLCRELVQLHGGTIWVQSRTGEGSTFSFVIPREPENQGAQVLVIDDETELGQWVCGLLESEGFRARTCQSGVEGLQMMRKQLPDVVILDLDMPGMDGAQVLKEIRGSWGLMPVILHTGYPESALLARALEFSPFTLLAKPSTPVQLLATVRGIKKYGDTSFWGHKSGQLPEAA